MTYLLVVRYVKDWSFPIMHSTLLTFVSGEVDDEIDTDQQKDWDAYWRILFKKVEVKDIQEFNEKYRGK